MKRKALGKKLRFEIFKRDSFTCQYCGEKAPTVVLHVDHIQPFADGGSDDLVNLITSCVACNLGKGARGLSDDTVVRKQQAQLEELQERREQLEMMVDWQKGLINLEQDTVDMMTSFWTSLEPGSGIRGLNEYARGEIRKWLKKNPAEDVIAAMREAAERMTTAVDGTTDVESIGKAFHFIPALLRVKAESKTEPFIRDAYYIRGILRRRFEDSVDEREAKELLLEAMNLGSSPEQEKDRARIASSWWTWRSYIDLDIAELKEGQ